MLVDAVLGIQQPAPDRLQYVKRTQQKSGLRPDGAESSALAPTVVRHDTDGAATATSTEGLWQQNETNK